MDISCDIIRDLLPLYAEDMVSDATRNMVDDHLCRCEPCTRELVRLKKETKIPMEVETTSLQRVEHTIRRRKVLTVAAAIMTLIALVVTVSTFLTTPYILTAEEAIEGVELRENGGLAIDYARGVNGTSFYAVFDTDNNSIVCHTNRYDWYQAEKLDKQLEAMTREEIEAYIINLYKIEECTQKDWDRFMGVSVYYGTFQTHDGEFLHTYDSELWTEENGTWTNKENERNHWYLNPKTGDVDMLLWDSGKPGPNSVLWTTSYAYGYVLWGSLILAAVFYAISRKSFGRGKEILLRLCIIFICVAVSTLLVTNGQLRTLEYAMSYEWNQIIFNEALVLSLAVLLWHHLYRLNKQDKGE